MAKKLSLTLPSILGLLLLVSAPASHATLYTFSQGGYDEGASISGSFVANDLDSSGQIVAGSPSLGFPGFQEVSAFNLSFSGNSIVGAFSYGLADLSALIYTLGSPFLGDQISPLQEVIAANWVGATGFNYASGMGAGGFGGSVTDAVSGAISYSDELVSVTSVPAPATLWLIVAAVPGLFKFGRSKLVELG